MTEPNKTPYDIIKDFEDLVKKYVEIPDDELSADEILLKEKLIKVIDYCMCKTLV